MKTENLDIPVFYQCSICGNTVEMIDSSGLPMTCCGKKMQQLIANDSDATEEKHLPVFDIDEGKVYVQVGIVKHPMNAEHHIEWIELVTNKGIQRKRIYPDPEPVAWFYLAEDEKPLILYEYCNLHGLWVTYI